MELPPLLPQPLLDLVKPKQLHAASYDRGGVLCFRALNEFEHVRGLLSRAARRAVSIAGPDNSICCSIDAGKYRFDLLKKTIDVHWASGGGQIFSRAAVG